MSTGDDNERVYAFNSQAYDGTAGTWHLVDKGEEPNEPMTWKERRAFKREQRREKKMLKRVTKEAMRIAKREAKAKARERKLNAAIDARNAKKMRFYGDLCRSAVYEIEMMDAARKIIDGQGVTPDGTPFSADFCALVFGHADQAAQETRLKYRDLRDRRFKYVTAIGTWITALLVTFMLTMCSACGAAFMRPGTTRTVLNQDAATVSIDKWCVVATETGGKIELSGGGSGVAIDDTHVLTAYHVTTCTNKLATANFYITTSDGRTLYATVTKTAPDNDIALLTLKDGSLGVEPVQISGPIKGDDVCVSPAKPNRNHKCGVVKSIKSYKWGGNIRTSINIRHGNSGSGVYNSKGRLVGIAVSLEWCTPFDEALYDLGVATNNEETKALAETCSGNASTIPRSVLP